MNTITSFFTSIVIFFSGLFGGVSDTKPAVVNPPVVIQEFGVSNTSVDTASKNIEIISPDSLDIKTVKVGDVYGDLKVISHEVTPNSTRIKFSGNMIATGILGINEMTGSLILSATKEGSLQIPKFKGDENSNGGFCLTGEIGKIIESIANIKNITVEVKNYSIYIAGKGGCRSSAELVRIIDQVSKNDSNLDSIINKIKNTTYSFSPLGKGSDGKDTIQVKMSEGKSVGSDGWSREIVSVAVDEKSGTAVVALNVSSGASTHFPMIVSFADISSTLEQKDTLLPGEYSSIKSVSFDTNGKVRVTTLAQGLEKVFVYELNSTGRLSLTQ